LQDALLDEWDAQTHDRFHEDRHPGEAEEQRHERTSWHHLSTFQARARLQLSQFGSRLSEGIFA
jgi:hypothetical protein